MGGAISLSYIFSGQVGRCSDLEAMNEKQRFFQSKGTQEKRSVIESMRSINPFQVCGRVVLHGFVVKSPW